MSNRAVVYGTAPQMEFKAEEELYRGGFEPLLPTEQIERRTPGRKPVVRNVPLMRGYITANGKPHDAKYVGKPLGLVDPGEINRLASNYDKRQKPCENPYSIGDNAVLGEIPVVVASVEGENCVASCTLIGKQHLWPVHYSILRPG